MKMFFEQMANVPATSFLPNYTYEKRGLSSPSIIFQACGLWRMRQCHVPTS